MEDKKRSHKQEKEEAVMTLKEIAAEAGVSISTVSRVINKSSKSPASKEVQDRIWEIVRRTGYTPNKHGPPAENGRHHPLARGLPLHCLPLCQSP